METATVEVYLKSPRGDGQSDNTVIKHDVTPAEVVVLAHANGGRQSVQWRGVGEPVHRTKHAERQRLAYVYTPETVATLFPGASAEALPAKFSDIGFGPDEDAPKVKRSRKKETAQIEQDGSETGDETGDNEGAE